MNNLSDVWFLRDIQCQLLAISNKLNDDELFTKENALEELVKVIKFIDENTPELILTKIEVK